MIFFFSFLPCPSQKSSPLLRLVKYACCFLHICTKKEEYLSTLRLYVTLGAWNMSSWWRGWWKRRSGFVIFFFSCYYYYFFLYLPPLPWYLHNQRNDTSVGEYVYRGWMKINCSQALPLPSEDLFSSSTFFLPTRSSRRKETLSVILLFIQFFLCRCIDLTRWKQNTPYPFFFSSVI